MDAVILGNLFTDELMKSFPRVAEHLEDYIIFTTAKDGSSDYGLTFVEHTTDTLSETEKQDISATFYKVKAQLMHQS